jgi:hypothetical protein
MKLAVEMYVISKVQVNETQYRHSRDVEILVSRITLEITGTLCSKNITTHLTVNCRLYDSQPMDQVRLT